MTPQYILRKSLCRTPHCCRPYELRDIPLKDWPEHERKLYLRHAKNYIETLGMNADPKKIYDEFVAHGHKRLLFQIDEVSQFYVTFCIWEKVE